jgi:hypothetical protein
VDLVVERDLWAVAIVFRTDRTPWEATVFRPVDQRVFHDAAGATAVVLAVLP